MSKLIIANVDNEHQVKDISHYTVEENSEILLCNFRMLWLAKPGDTVVLPASPPAEILEYWALLNGCDHGANALTILVPPLKDIVSSAFLRQERLLHAEFVEQCRLTLSNMKADEHPTEVLAYYPDNYCAEFAEKIGVEVPDGFYQQGGATMFNQKTIFRKIAAGLDLSIPEGRVCDNSEDLKRAILDFMSSGKDFIIKMDRHSGGFGNVIVHGPHSSYKKHGSSRHLNYTSVEAGEALACSLAEQSDDSSVIEEYLPADTILYSEYFIEGPGHFHHVNDGTMDMEPLWVGFEIPGQYELDKRIEFLDNSARIVSAASSLGHRGFVNVDGLVAGSRCVINEINARCGGCTHIVQIARALFGDDVLSKKSIKSYNHGQIFSPDSLIEELRTAGLLYVPGQVSGIIPFNADYEHGSFEYMAVANSLEEARKLDVRVKQRQNAAQHVA